MNNSDQLPEDHLEFPDLVGWNEVIQAQHGNLIPLIELLSSNVIIGRVARDYIADQIGRDVNKRFVRESMVNLEKRKEDERLLLKIDWAKWRLALKEIPSGATEDEQLNALELRDAISDKRALDHLAEFGEEIDAAHLANVRRRLGRSLINPKKGRRSAM